MSFNTMLQRLLLEVPGLAKSYAQNYLLPEALNEIYDSNLWSWQLQEANFLTPGLLFGIGTSPYQSTGTITATPYSNQVIGDTLASAAWQAYLAAGSQPFFTSLQIRVPYYSLYNIIAIDDGTLNPPFTTLTLDRPWGEPGGALQSYMIYQAYFPVPVPNFKRFLAARDTTNNSPMDFSTYGQKDLAIIDPQRVVFDDPLYFVPYEVDNRPGSATFGNFMVELYPHPLSVLPYSFMYLYNGPQLVNPGDTVPYPLTEDALLWKAKTNAYLWKEAQKGDEMQRGSGADWRFLAQAAEAEYQKRIKPIRLKDDALAQLWWSRVQNRYNISSEGYANSSGQLNVGTLT